MATVDPDQEPILPTTFRYQGRDYPITYRSDGIDIEIEARKNSYLKYIIQNGISAEGWISERFVEAVIGRSFLVGQIRGMSYSGKSLLGIQLAIFTYDFWSTIGITGKIYHAKNWSEALDLVSMPDPNLTVEFDSDNSDHFLLKQGDILVVDEETTLTGREKKQDETKMKNVLRACRALGISFYFCDPDPEKKPNVDFTLRIMGIVRDLWLTICIVYSPDLNIVGMWTVPIEQTERMRIAITKYLPFKAELIGDLRSTGGTVKRSTMGQKQELEALRLIRYLKRKFPDKRISKSDLKTYIVDREVGLAGSTGQWREEVIHRAWNVYKEQLAKGHKIKKDDDTGIVWTTHIINKRQLPEGIKTEIKPYLIDEMHKHNKRVEAKGKGVHIEPIWIDEFLHWIEERHISQQQVADWYTAKVGNNPEKDEPWSQGLAGKHMMAVRNSILGYAVEEWLANQHPDWNHIGGNTDDPDFWTDTHVISVKARCRGNIQCDIADFGKKERKLAIDTGRTLILDMYELKYSDTVTTWIAEPSGTNGS